MVIPLLEKSSPKVAAAAAFEMVGASHCDAEDVGRGCCRAAAADSTIARLQADQLHVNVYGEEIEGTLERSGDARLEDSTAVVEGEVLGG